MKNGRLRGRFFVAGAHRSSRCDDFRARRV